jgi:hypothetical protein
MELVLCRRECWNLDINGAENPSSATRDYIITYRFCLHLVYKNYFYSGK